MDTRRLADATGLSDAEIRGILNGSIGITSDTAVRIEKVLSIPARFWLNMQEAYDAFQTSTNTNP